jgi:Cu(I)/Ag(I) efflux system membrane fusion protein
MRRTPLIIFGFVLVAAAAGGGGYWFAMSRMAQAHPPAASEPDASGKTILYWFDPMVPQQHFDKPGKSPFMDMQLVPRHADEAGGEGTVSIDPRVLQNLGVRTATATTGSVERRI